LAAITSTRASPCHWRRFSRLPVEKSSSTTTCQRAATRASTVCEPMKPAPPVTRASGRESLMGLPPLGRLKEPGDQDLEGDVVVATLRDDEVGPPPGGLDELLVHRAHRSVVLLADRGERAAALLEVAPDAAEHPDVGVGVHEDLDVELLADRRRDEGEDPLDQDHRGRHHLAGPGRPGVAAEVVDRHLDRLAGPEDPEVLGEELALEGVRMIVVEGGALLRGQVAPV